MLEMTFLNWDQPLLTKLVNHLLESKDELAEKIIVVPTIQSGRQLRRALAKAGVGLSPRVVTPEILLPKRNAGTCAANLAAWTNVLLHLELEETRGLFPKDPPQGVIHSFRWAFNVAKQLSELGQTLLDNGKGFAEISRRSIEYQRWEDLALLDERVTSTLRQWRLKYNNKKEREHISIGKKMIIAGVCDISSLAITRLEELLESNISVEVVVHANESMRVYFDKWGRPHSNYWSQCDLPIADWKNKVTIAETPALTAKHIVSNIANGDLIPEQFSLGLCDRGMALSMQEEFAVAGWDIYDPEGASVRCSSLVLFLTALGEWLAANAGNPIRAFSKLIRLREMEAFMPENSDRYKLTCELDECLDKRIPLQAKNLDHYLQTTQVEDYPQLKKCLNHFLTETERMLSGNKMKGLRGWMAKLLNRTHSEVANILVDDIADILDALENIEKYSKGESLDMTQAIEILIEVISSKKSYPDKSGTAADLLGWMELIYEDAPELFLTGMHEGHVPEFHGDDPFLPDSFREMLDMESGNHQYARDSYLFRSFMESRENVHIGLSKLSEINEPATPSRLLLRTTGKELAERVQAFFGDPQLVSKNPSAWQRDWQLKIPNVSNPYSLENDPVRSLSPTALKNYLNCPFRFFLDRVVGMKRFSANKAEMSALDFGLLVHAVVEKFGRDTSMRDSIVAKEIQNYFDDLLEKEMFIRFGASPNLAVKMQSDIARSRLHKLAAIQAEETVAGWRIIDVELDIGSTKDEEIPWSIIDHPINMQIDRVDQHLDTGEIRVMDYKTSGKATDPLKAHIANFNPGEQRKLCGELLPAAKKGRTERRWKDLQLPIYAWFAQQHYKRDELPSVGYINMPNTLSDTSFTIWEDFDKELLCSAKEWTKNAIQNIQQSHFNEPVTLLNREENWDDFSKLSQGNIAEAFGLA